MLFRSSTAGRLQSTRGLIAGYAKVAEFRAKALDVEMSRLDSGKSDSRKVLQAEQDLVEARLMRLKSLVDLQKARIELEMAEGVAPQDRGLEPELESEMSGSAVPLAEEKAEDATVDVEESAETAPEEERPQSFYP